MAEFNYTFLTLNFMTCGARMFATISSVSNPSAVYLCFDTATTPELKNISTPTLHQALTNVDARHSTQRYTTMVRASCCKPSFMMARSNVSTDIREKGRYLFGKYLISIYRIKLNILLILVIKKSRMNLFANISRKREMIC